MTELPAVAAVNPILWRKKTRPVTGIALEGATLHVSHFTVSYTDTVLLTGRVRYYTEISHETS